MRKFDRKWLLGQNSGRLDGITSYIEKLEFKILADRYGQVISKITLIENLESSVDENDRKLAELIKPRHVNSVIPEVHSKIKQEFEKAFGGQSLEI